jgi:hypothetical protein
MTAPTTLLSGFLKLMDDKKLKLSGKDDDGNAYDYGWEFRKLRERSRPIQLMMENNEDLYALERALFVAGKKGYIDGPMAEATAQQLRTDYKLYLFELVN